ncbi:E3 ubiquitin-protein ligase HERC2-like isoform X2 [Cynoglossus semilaevis]|uniref:E3 ubiquitin-protein ligase HERC2-like isoform X2 n=1 Tax=Cynoglossus semilaevis TaxID=244447 RepID=UPI0007DCAB6A|nr:E3 ubiquitin-protein ligase HERC2-like isoform X2 [Cynoglossus semilaevis]
MPSPSFTLDAQLRFHDKWLKIDLQRAFSPEGLSEMWNEMVKDEEITFSGGEDAAHPDCDCFGAQKKDEANDKEKKEEEETSASVHHAIIESWDWGRQPGQSRSSSFSSYSFSSSCSSFSSSVTSFITFITVPVLLLLMDVEWSISVKRATCLLMKEKIKL